MGVSEKGPPQDFLCKEQERSNKGILGNLPLSPSTRGTGGGWRSIYPNAVKCLETDIEDLLTFFHIKEDKLWSKIRTTNAIERAFREIRRRTRPIGVFTNRESVERIVFAVFHHLNVNWENNPLKEFTHKN